jgi:hypothetical protein
MVRKAKNYGDFKHRLFLVIDHMQVRTRPLRVDRRSREGLLRQLKLTQFQLAAGMTPEDFGEQKRAIEREDFLRAERARLEREYSLREEAAVVGIGSSDDQVKLVSASALLEDRRAWRMTRLTGVR